MTDHSAPSDAALALLKAYEQGPDGGFSPVVYRCPAGKRTIGWGHVVRPGEAFPQPLTEVEADRLLRDDLRALAGPALAAVRVPLTQSMIDALACFAFNVGPAAFAGSTLLKKLNAGQYAAAAAELLKWDKARDPKTGQKVALAGLTRRRAAERALFAREGWPQ